MGRINVLDTVTANRIKAGEVIERPVSVVKELFDNAADAGASVIKIEFTAGGISCLRVSDNGIGMDREDALKAFLIHATSKLSKIEDLYDLSTFGFRGEALASIASVADCTLITKQADSPTGTKVVYEDGKQVLCEDISCENGTVIEVRGLFKNVPARYKFLKKDSTEGMYICSLVERLAVVNPHIQIKLFKDGKQIMVTPGNGNDLDTIYAVYGKEVANCLVPVSYETDFYRLSGFTGKTDHVRGNRSLQCIYVNDRNIKNQTITAAIDEAYKNAVMKNRFPVCFLKIYCKPGSVDVNVHPQKSEVKFSYEQDIFRLVFHGIRTAVFEANTPGSFFEGLNNDIPDVPEAKPLKKAPGKQLSFDVSRSVSSEVTKESADKANDLLRILSGFKPDIAEISGDDIPDPEPPPEEAQEEQLFEPIAPEEPTMHPEIRELVGSEFVGILFVTYIILQSEEHVFFVDQHAAHERVLYEKFMDKKDPEKIVIEKQDCLVPAILRLSAADYTFVSDNTDRFAENGFDIELLDNREIALRSTPMTSTRRNTGIMFEEILTDLKRETPSKSNIWYSLIQTTACKAAIKAGDVITRDEALALIDQMSVLKDPFHCAHGRPTFFKISKKDFEKNFKRIV